MKKSQQPIPKPYGVQAKYEWIRRDTLSSETSSEYSGASGYSSNYSGSTNSITPPSSLIRLAKKWTQPRAVIPSTTVPMRNVELIKIQARSDMATVHDCNTTRTWEYQTIDPSPTNLVNTIIGTLEVTGTLTPPLLSILSGAKRIASMVFHNCRLLCSAVEFSSLIRSLSTSSLTFIGCKFSDAQLIGDRLFTKNKQLNRIVIGPAHKEHFSFPCLTNASLRTWRHTVPVQIHLTNVETSITAEAVADVAKRLTRHQTFSWSLGKIPLDISRIRTIFGKLPLENVQEVVTVAKKVHILYWNQSVIAFNCCLRDEKKIMYRTESKV